jgi:hypothetical protein
MGRRKAMLAKNWDQEAKLPVQEAAAHEPCMHVRANLFNENDYSSILYTILFYKKIISYLN